MAKLNEFELERLLPTEDFSHGAVADVFTQAWPRQGIRSAIANALAASGDSQLANSFSLRNPALSYLGSIGLGGVLGAGLGNIGQMALGDQENSVPVGSILGALLGSIVGGTANALYRRNLIKKIKKEIKNKNLDYTKIPDRKASALLNPIGAMYNADELATKVLLKKKDKTNDRIDNTAYKMMYGDVPLSQAVYMASGAIPYLSLLSSPLYLANRIAGRRGDYREELED